MNNAASSRPSVPPSWRGKTPGFIEFNILINQLADPALLVDLHRGLVFSANSHFLKLTAFTLAEILNIPLLDLLPELSQTEPAPGEEFETLLNRRNRESLPVITRLISLDPANQWQLVSTIPVTVYQQNLSVRQRQDHQLQALANLGTILDQSDLESSLDVAMRIGHDLLDASILCVYQADSLVPQLEKTAAWHSPDHELLPDFLPPPNLLRLREPTLWLPGKRVATDLHRIARISNLSYLASVSLGQEGAWSGLLVAGDTHAQPVEKILAYLGILAANITSALDHYILVSNLQQKIDSLTHSMVVQNTVLDNAREGIIFLKPDLTVLELNPTAELMLGYAAQEVAGKHAETILIGTETLPAALNSALQGIPTHNLGNIKLHRRSGQPFMAHAQTIPVKVAEQLSAIAVILSDVSENEQIRVRTQQLEQRAVLGEVMAIFAHEVRNPINNISTGLQLMGLNFPAEDPNQELISRLQHDCSRLTHLMESVLSFSRPMEYRMERTDISSLLGRLVERWGPRMARYNITPFVQTAPGCPQINGDARALEQVFTNLVSNAVQAMSTSGGTLAIKVTPFEDSPGYNQVEVAVSDTGPGIPDEIRDHIFEPFVTTNPQGTGLGLAITKRIVTAHKGTISVNSFPGGTVFQVCLPVYQGEVS
jgi:PAS domain S-box-containing protein